MTVEQVTRNANDGLYGYGDRLAEIRWLLERCRELETLAYAVADAWFANAADDPAANLARMLMDLDDPDALTEALREALDALEAATRNSPLRKVKP
jgi:hypothetical protein